MNLRHLVSFAGMIVTSLTGGQGSAATPEPKPLDWSAMPLPAVAGGTLAPDLLRGKVVLLVNTASYCGFTPQYQGLEALWKRYRDLGFVLLGVPANDFGAQEPGNDSEISRFCQVTYGIDFPMLAKQAVVGRDAHPLYRWALSQTGRRGQPKWNFHKILIGRDGRLVAWFSSTIDPASPRLAAAIEQALAAR